ncbi:MAG: PAS domain-containing protein [Betaproteobacteria bacterium]|nr:PAS domain-containing protein [Betaproteobacteria bacterium]MDE2210337.1 PAS domain-containing protein [Betaproteobacteria bacterium]MDE2358564.1 PAS domain-containing protein [Betaproteobacteria bacterium]
MRLRLAPAKPPEPPPVARRGLELLAAAVLLLDESLQVIYVNPAAENLFELSYIKFKGHAIDELFGGAPALRAAIDRAVRTGASYTEQELELGLPGKPRLHLVCTVSPVDAADATLLLEFRHIDQQLKIAREERQREQQQANRELIRNLAHEIKNPLGGIRGAAQLLERELDRPQLIEYTQVIIAEADRLRTLVNRLLSPHRAPTYRRINVHQVLVRVKGLVQAEFPAIPVVCDFDTSLPDLDADDEQLVQALLNIVRNAAQALSGSVIAAPEIRMTTRVARGVTLARRHHRTALSIAIEDNGPGIPEELRERIFFPLVSGRDGGSGLGLTIAQTFVSQHGGTIDCASVAGRTVFTVLLPLSAGRG